MLSRNQRINVLIYLCFWLLYTPLAVFEWVYSGRSSLLDLSIVLLIGLGVVLAALFIRDRFTSNTGTNIGLYDEDVNEELTDEDDEVDIFVGFRRLFSPNGVSFQSSSVDGGLSV